MRRFVIPVIVALALAIPLVLAGFTGSSPAEAAPSINAVPGQYIVTLKEGEQPAPVSSRMTAQDSIQVKHVYNHALNGFSAKIPDSKLDEIRNDPAVLSVVEDRVITIAAETSPNGIRRSEADRNAISQIGSDSNPINVDVAVIDTGIDSDHPDLNVVGGISCVPGQPSWDDQHGHGTHVAGIIGALDNDSGVVGVAPGARLWAVRVLNASGEGEFSDLMCGVDWITANAATIDVANMSLGGEGQVTGCSNGGLHQAICESVAAGITYVAASGNSGVNAGGFIPAAYPEVITVSAIADTDGKPGGSGPSSIFYGADDTLATFSNYGSVVDIAAPGVNIQSTWLNGGYSLSSGTSMASPHVAGAAAIYAHQNPGASPAAVRSHILSEAWPQSSSQGFSGDRDAFPEPLLNAGTIGGLEPLPPPPPPVAGCSLSNESGAVGSQTTITCTGYQPSEWVWIYWDSTGGAFRGLFIASGSGDGSAVFTIPSATYGEHQIIASGATSGIQGSQVFNVEPSLKLNTTSGGVGSSMFGTLKGFGAGEPVEVRWYSESETYSVLKTVTTNANGEATAFTTVPAGARGTYTIEAIGTNSGASSTAEFSITPGLRVSPTLGKTGSTATATVSGFEAGEDVSIRWSGVQVASGQADSSGAAALQFTVPEAPYGANQVEAVGGNGSQATATFTISPAISMSQTTGIVGTNVEIDLTGFAAGETLQLKWFHTPLSFTPIVTTQTTQTGRAGIALEIPEAIKGYHKIEVTGLTSGRTVYGGFNVQAHMELSATSGLRGDTITATLTGHPGSTSVNLKWYEVPYPGDVIEWKTTTSLGNVTFTFQIPDDTTYGDHKIESALSNGLAQASAIFSVESVDGPVEATCEPASSSAAPGARVEVSCYGFAPSEFARIYWDTTASNQIGTIYLPNGSGNALVTIPDAPAGEHTLIAVGSASGAQSNAAFTVEGSMSFSTSSGAVGSYASATVRGMGASETVDIFWQTDSESVLVHSAATNASGRAIVFFAIPQVPGGTYSVEAVGRTSGESATAAFSVTGSVKLTPTLGKVGSNLSVAITGFQAGASVEIRWDGGVIGSVTLSPSGAGTFSTTVPAAVAGYHSVVADDGEGTSVSANYIVIADFQISSNRAAVGEDISLTFSGYGPWESIRIEWWDTTSSYTVIDTVQASQNGSASYVLTIPDATYNLHKIQAVGLQSQAKAFINFYVSPDAELSTVQGPIGTTVSVSLTGFKGGESVSLHWYTNAYTSYEVATGTTDAFGTATITFDVPDDATPGDHKVEGRSSSGFPRAEAVFTVTGGVQ